MTLLILQRSLPRERRNVKLMIQLFMVIDEGKGNKNPLNFKHFEEKNKDLEIDPVSVTQGKLFAG